MRKLLAYLGLMGMIIVGASCASPPLTPTITSQPHRSLAVTTEERVSGAPAGTITLHLNQPRYERGVDFLITLSNSTAESIQIPLVKGDDCYRNAFWFYMKTGTGWQPMMPVLSFRCLYSPPGELIASGSEKELNLRAIAENRLLADSGPASYMLRVKYAGPQGQEFSLYTDKFNQGIPEPIDEVGITVEQATSDALEWKVMKHSSQLVWLAPLCSSSKLGGGTIDEERSTLQRLTEAGSWSNLPVACNRTSTVIEVPEDETMMIDGRQWLEDAGLLLQPGQYRWDLVFFLKAYGEPPLSIVEQGRHIFSPVFSIPN
jgi:hypothetical protein